MNITQIKILVITLITFFVLMLNIIIKNIFNEYTLSLFLTIVLTITILLIGFDKARKIKEKQVLKTMLFYTISFLVLIYALGLKTGYLKTAYSLEPISIIKNVFPVIFLIVVEELLRYTLLRKSRENKLLNIIVVLMTSAIDTILVINLYNRAEITDLLELATITILPSFSKNIMLNNVSKNYGYYPAMGYQLIMNLYIYYLPVVPNLGIYLESVVMLLVPIVIKEIINRMYPIAREKEVKQSEIRKTITICEIAIIVIIVVLYSNLGPYWIAAIASGSMEPTIKIGDAVIIDKTITTHIEKLKVGDIIVFKNGNSIYTHRIVEMKKKNDKYKILTKGDRKGNVVDDWVVEEKDIIGKVRMKIPYIGYPTVQIKRIIEGKQNE